MSANIIYPNIKGSEKEQLAAVRSYLYRLADQLNYALSEVAAAPASPSGSVRAEPEKSSAGEIFNEVKALIIKSADIVDSYCEEINRRLSSVYVAQSDFGEYREETENTIAATAGLLSATVASVQSISGDVTALRETNAYFRAGMLDGGQFGVEIGRTTSDGGGVTFSRYARFLPNRLSFFDSEGNELAWFSDYRLHVHGVAADEIKAGGYRLDTSDGLTFLWEG